MIRNRHLLFAGVALALLCSHDPVGARGRSPALRTVDGRAGPSSASRRPPTSLNRYQREKLTSWLGGSAQATGDTLRVIALRVQFADSLMGGQPGSHRAAVRDSTWFANELSHLSAYFEGASRGRLHLAATLDTDLVTLPRGMQYYGDDRFEETRVVVLARTLIDSVDARVDFARYDHVFIIHAGAGQETDLAGDSPGQIWSSFYDRSDIDDAFADTTIAGLATGDSLGARPFLIDNFSIVPASPSQDFATVGSLGVWAFEVASRIGLVPLFDSTPEGVQDSQGVGAFDLMAFGLFNVNGFVPAFPSAFNRVIAGWLDPVVVDAQTTSRTIRLADVNSSAVGDTTCLLVPLTGNEYYLVVNRVHDANFDSLFTFGDVDSNLVPGNGDSLDGAEFDFFLTDLTNPFVRRFDARYGFNVLFRHTGSGIYVWHVDEAVIRQTLVAGMLPDDFVEHKGVDLEEADGVQDLDRGGPAGFALGSHWDSFRSGDGNAGRFGTDTEPDTRTNLGAPTGIVFDNISAPGPSMTLTVRLAAPYGDVRRRWTSSSSGQPATPVDFPIASGAGMAVLSDTSGVFLFGAGGETFGADGDSNTVDPYIAVPGEMWSGWPAVADLDALPGDEFVAAGRSGRVYAWHGDRTELVDGDADAGTVGVLYQGAGSIATPPVLADFSGDSAPDVLVFEDTGDTLTARILGANGALMSPGDPVLAAAWPMRVAAQSAAPAVVTEHEVAGVRIRGVFVAAVDTATLRVRVAYAPVVNLSSPATTPAGLAWTHSFGIPAGFRGNAFVLSPPAVGDIDNDGDDEVVLTAPDGVVRIYETGGSGSHAPLLATLRSGALSAPALGDVDGNGTLEIAVWDGDYRYLLASNGRVLTNWPVRIHSAFVEERPPSRAARALSGPVIADIDGNRGQEIIFPFDDGTLHAFSSDGREVASFPRPGPSGPSTPTISSFGGAGLKLALVGTTDALAGVNTVADSFLVRSTTSVYVQTLPGSVAGSVAGYPMAGGGRARTGRAAPPGATVPSTGGAEASFIVYPNPVKGSFVHARVILNSRARVTVNVYTLEGEEAISRSFDANVAGAVGTPFDEPIDVSRLKSGIYFMRVGIDGGASTMLVKTFAIRR